MHDVTKLLQKSSFPYLYYCIFLSTNYVIFNNNELYESLKIVPKTLFKSLCDLFIEMTLKSINYLVNQFRWTNKSKALNLNEIS